MGGRGYGGGGRVRAYTYRYTVTTRMTCIKMGNDESHFNVSLIVREKVTRQCPQTTTKLWLRDSVVYVWVTGGLGEGGGRWRGRGEGVWISGVWPTTPVPGTWLTWKRRVSVAPFRARPVRAPVGCHTAITFMTRVNRCNAPPNPPWKGASRGRGENVEVEGSE